MTKDELITKQQLLIEEYKEKLIENDELLKQLNGMFYSIGQPLNDNNLQMNKKQLAWCFEVDNLISQINRIYE